LKPPNRDKYSIKRHPRIKGVGRKFSRRRREQRKKRPKISKKYRKIVLFQGGSSGKKTEK